MNPIKALLDSFDRLINERGSANILRERLTLASDQFAFLEQKFAVSERENSELKVRIQALEAEKQNLKLDNAEKTEKIESLKKHIEQIKDIGTRSDPNWGAFT